MDRLFSNFFGGLRFRDFLLFRTGSSRQFLASDFDNGGSRSFCAYLFIFASPPDQKNLRAKNPLRNRHF
jgi:hypothetical protein